MKRIILLLAVFLFTFLKGDFFTQYSQKNYFGNCTARTLMVRSGPDKSYDIITTIKKDEKVDILSFEGEWIKIQVEDHIGYVAKEHISIYEFKEEFRNNKKEELDTIIKEKHQYSPLMYIAPQLFNKGWAINFYNELILDFDKNDFDTFCFPNINGSILFIIILFSSLIYLIYLLIFYFNNIDNWFGKIELSYPFWTYPFFFIISSLINQDKNFIVEITFFIITIIYFALIVKQNIKKEEKIYLIISLIKSFFIIISIQYVLFIVISTPLYIYKFILFILEIAFWMGIIVIILGTIISIAYFILKLLFSSSDNKYITDGEGNWWKKIKRK